MKKLFCKDAALKYPSACLKETHRLWISVEFKEKMIWASEQEFLSGVYWASISVLLYYFSVNGDICGASAGCSSIVLPVIAKQNGSNPWKEISELWNVSICLRQNNAQTWWGVFRYCIWVWHISWTHMKQWLSCTLPETESLTWTSALRHQTNNLGDPSQ